MEKHKYKWYKDISFWTLLFSNALAIITVQKTEISALNIVLIFWIQSLIIGVFAVLQMSILKDVSASSNLKDKDLERKEKILMISYFVVVYVFFHVAYFIAIRKMFYDNVVNMEWRIIILLAATFFIHHLYSFIKSRKNLVNSDTGSIMGQVYGRIIPMNAGIMAGSLNPLEGLLPSLFLKAIIDLIAHSSKHKNITNEIQSTSFGKEQMYIYIFMFSVWLMISFFMLAM